MAVGEFGARFGAAVAAIELAGRSETFRTNEPRRTPRPHLLPDAGTSPEAAVILLAQASVCLDLAAKSREFWVTASLIDLIDLARELLNRANRDR